ncbi:hypothetical protein LWI29_026876 [Acer saccharum]|uniref:Retrovirus-related Pol polyprotein from transposon RE1 n=1 Tax=Acer saccharum TaxID=4024 RepID=A0AA39W6H7_ACESA|nr:hypothetical protein LWI29_026876 [Acer saccharum]
MAVRSKPNPVRYERSNRPYGSQESRSQERQPEHFRQDRRRPGAGAGRGRPNCSHCGEMGHWVQTCYELNGYPVGHPKAKFNSSPRGFSNNKRPAVNNVAEGSSKIDGSQVVGISEDQLKQLLSLVGKNDDSISQANAVTKPDLSKIASRNWIIDSGATDHISSSSKLFLRKNKSCSLPPVLLPSGDKANIIVKGSLPLNYVYYLHNVLCVPTFKVDLISVSRLTRGLNCSITFFPYWCILQDLATRRMIGLGKQRDGPIRRPLFILSGKRPCVLSCGLSRPTAPGLLLRFQLVRLPLAADGCIKSSSDRMGLLRGTGFTQLEGIDFQDTFSPTAKIVSVRCLLALAAARGWSLHQMDVNNAFLHGDLDEEIYMSPPPRLQRQGENNLVCRLHKSLYCLKQASRQWLAKFSEAICSAGFVQSRADYSLFTKTQGKLFTALLIYVDDILITGNNPVSIAATKKFLHNHFNLKDLGNLKYFLGIEVSASKRGIFISQRKYALEIIEDVGLLGAAPIDTPMEQGLKLSDKSDSLKDPSRHRRLVGRLIYLTVSRLDITYAVHVLSRFMHQPRKLHMEAALRVVRYLKGAPGQGLFFSSNSDFRLRAYCDSDWVKATENSFSFFCRGRISCNDRSLL